jgi:hypothetical protein
VVGGKTGLDKTTHDCKPRISREGSGAWSVVGVGEGGAVVSWSQGGELRAFEGVCDGAELSAVVFDGAGSLWATGGRTVYCLDAMPNGRVADAVAGVLPSAPVGLGVVLDHAVAVLADGTPVFATMVVDRPA